MAEIAMVVESSMTIFPRVLWPPLEALVEATTQLDPLLTGASGYMDDVSTLRLIGGTT